MNIIITGASRGIGYELAKIFAADSKNTIIAIARNQQKLNSLKKDCLKANPKSNVILLPIDLQSSSIKEVITKEIKKNFKSIDILINNAGSIVNKPFKEIKLSDLTNVYQTNVFAVFQIIQTVLPFMNTKNRAHIVNISSMGGVQGSVKFSGLTAYSSSKAALICLTECLAEEYKNKNISFNCLALGAAQTEMLQEAFPGYRAPITAKQMAEFIANFSTSAYNFINGKVIQVSLSTP